MDQGGGHIPAIAEPIAVAGGEVQADVAVVAVGRAEGVAGEVLPILGLE